MLEFFFLSSTCTIHVRYQDDGDDDRSHFHRAQTHTGFAESDDCRLQGSSQRDVHAQLSCRDSI